ncbi:MAG: TPM domain-containing protein [Rikenellaceae bacterium]|nr:TPM domain-containing protein [Rikenellaceae bacterium]MCL2693218.1 TPM domain-containing protein [Rikenellaceae bacterium]
MKYFSKIFALCCLSVLAGIASAFSQGRVYGVADVPNPQNAGAWNFVSNPDGTLSAATVSEANRTLAALREQTGAEVAVVAVGSIGELPIEEFGLGILRNWGIGRRDRNDGLLILLVTDDRLVRFEVGFGLEGVMTDALGKRIQTARMMPYLQAGDWNGAVLAAVAAVAEVLTDPASELHREDAAQAEEPPLWVILLLLLGGVGVIMALAMFAQRHANRCARCGTQMRAEGTKAGVTTMKCPKCGNTTTRRSGHSIGGTIAGGMIGGMMGGRRGGFGGGLGGGGRGGFGGGFGGGGGATTRF